MATLKDIAKEANVSIMTVSNVVNGNLHKVSKEKAKLIQDIIRKRNYVQNETARGLAKANSNIIAVMLRNIRGENSLSSMHNATLLGSMTQRIQDLGFYAMVNLVEGQADISRTLRSWNVQGAIFLGMFDDEIEEIYAQSSIPMVFIDSYSTVRSISSVGIDDYKGAQMAADYLLQQGHRSIAFVGPPDYAHSVIQHRIKGFTDKLSANGLTLPKEHRIVVDSASDPASADKAVHALIKLLPSISAAFVNSDQTAASIISGLSKRNIRVPEQLSIIGFDNVQISMQTSPQLTTISQDLDKKAALTVNILKHRMENPFASAESHVLDIDLIIRDSVAKKY